MSKFEKKLKDRKKAKGQWYKMTAFFDGEAQKIAEINNENVLLQGTIPPDNDCAVVLVPTSTTQEQGLALTEYLEGNFRKSHSPYKVITTLTNNIQLVKLKPVSEAEANEIMEKDQGGAIIHVEGSKED